MKSARAVSAAERETLAAAAGRFGPWFHNFEIAKDLWTNGSGSGPGADYPASRWRHVQPLLPDLTGKDCLDVGCSSGFFSLKLKEMGAASVLGIDAGEQHRAIAQAGFAAQTLGLDVQFREYSAYDLARIGSQFDLILFMGVFYHLRHPMVALEAIRHVCRRNMIFQTITTNHANRVSELPRAKLADVHLGSAVLREPNFPSLSFVENTLDGDGSCWFVPNPEAVVAMLRACGFEPETIVFPTERDILIRCKVR